MHPQRETMSGFADHLPLSQRGAFDESRVSGDWRPITAQCLLKLVDLLETVELTAWEGRSLRAGWRVRDVVAELLWRCDSRLWELGIERVQAAFRDPLTPDPDIIRLAAAAPSQLIELLRGLSTRRANRVGRRGIGDLSDVVSRSYEIARSCGRDLELPAVATGAVCLARMLSAPLSIRAAISGRSLEATDAGWAVGRGIALRAPAEQHVLFLFGRWATLPGTRVGDSAE